MKPKQYFFVLLGILVVIIGGGGYGYYYALQQLKGQSAQMSTDLAEEAAAQTQIQSLQELEGNYNHNVVPMLPMIYAAIPTGKNQTEILAQIERIAENDGVIQPFKSVSMPAPAGLPSTYSQTNKVGAVLALPISFEADGSYSQLQQFTYDLEHLNRYTNVVSLSINATDKSKPIAYTFTVNAYVYPL
jgi:Tfp pilus assembly protein PilO